MNRLFQILLIVSTLGLGWLLMMTLHECGHVLHGRLSGAELDVVHIPLIGFSRTDFVRNPHPLFVVWGGPIWGCLFPLTLLAAAKCCGMIKRISSAVKRYEFIVTWFAGFCLIVNGGYLLGGVLLKKHGADDPSVILLHGGAYWQLIAFGIIAIAAGLCLWNGLGSHFGFGTGKGQVDRRAAVVVTALFCLTVLALATR